MNSYNYYLTQMVAILLFQLAIGNILSDNGVGCKYVLPFQRKSISIHMSFPAKEFHSTVALLLLADLSSPIHGISSIINIRRKKFKVMTINMIKNMRITKKTSE